MKLKTCERCSVSFECRHDDIENCQCNRVVLSVEFRQKLAENYKDCLCVDCLKVLSEEASGQK